MNQIMEFIHRFDRRHLLAGVAAVLLIANLGRWGLDYLDSRQAELTDRMAILAQYREAVQRLPEIEARLAQLASRQQQLESFLFHGENEEKIASAMQIMLQSEVSNAGLEPEFIQPLRKGEGGERKEYGEIAIKIRMSGSLNDFGRFMHSRYSSKQFFSVENLTIKPFKPGELKISMDVRGYYKIAAGTGAAGKAI
ncbi:MAG: type II secretion system protein GspM [Pseudomonadota bacterium]